MKYNIFNSVFIYEYLREGICNKKKDVGEINEYRSNGEN